jgi:hypothetical protein
MCIRVSCRPKAGGLKLGGKKKADDFLSSLMAEGERVCA